MTNQDINNFTGCFGIQDEVQCKSTKLPQQYCLWNCNMSGTHCTCNNP